LLFVKILPIYALFVNENLSNCAVGAGTVGMHAALGDNLPIEVGEFLQKPDILQKRRASFPSGQCVLVVGDGSTCDVSQLLFHFFLLKIEIVYYRSFHPLL